MIQIGRGNILDTDVEALVNTVNTVGVMGKGLALQFKKAFPDNFTEYKKACDNKDLQPGKMLLHKTDMMHGPKYIINFPTKQHWRGKSKLEYIKNGLTDLIEKVQSYEIHSIAIPPLGCGHGGLDWSTVKPLIEEAFANLPDVRVVLFNPGNSPKADEMVNRTKKPTMTIGRAAVIGLIDSYDIYNIYSITVLEIQKLAYFLEMAGEPLNLEFTKWNYGPYADKLRHVLNTIEGHYLSGFADGRNKPDTEIRPLPGAIEEAREFLTQHPETNERFNKVAELIEGFETPYGLELLSSVHWAQNEIGVHADVESIIQYIKDWNVRKKNLFAPEHIKVALHHLRRCTWLPPAAENSE